MIVLLALAVVMLLVGLLAATYLLGFQLGGSSTLEELTRVRAEAIQASRRMHDLTQQAVVAMLDEAERQRRS